MKNLITSILLVFTLSLAGTLPSFAQEEDTAIHLDLDTDDKKNKGTVADPDEVKAKIKEVIDAVASKVKHKIDTEVEIDLGDVDEGDLEELENLKKRIEDSDWDDAGESIGEFVVAVVAIVFSLGLPIIILLLILIFSSRKRKQKMELINNFIAKDQPVPSELIQEFDTGESHGLRSGLKWTFIGLAISFAFLINGNTGGAAIGLIPLGLGLAKLLAWKLESDDKVL